jgi:5,10-methylene-tetrahydrofolate dehydrogenase/methenyl tetrahydrofolate cyclohydrolase
VPQLWENFVKEAKLLGEDLIKLGRFVYDAGVKARKAFGDVRLVKSEQGAETKLVEFNY